MGTFSANPYRPRTEGLQGSQTQDSLEEPLSSPEKGFLSGAPVGFFGVEGSLGFRVEAFKFRVWGLGLLGFRFWGVGFRV